MRAPNERVTCLAQLAGGTIALTQLDRTDEVRESTARSQGAVLLSSVWRARQIEVFEAGIFGT
jgi:hypothetical protein